MPTTPHPALLRRPIALDAGSDEALLHGLRRGDPGAGGAFVRRFQGRVYGLAKAMVGDPTQAGDIAQEALSRAWRHAEAYDSSRASVATWILSITHNLAVDHLRRHAAEPLDPRAVIFLDQVARGPAPEESASISEEAKEVRAALAQLPVQQRRALVLAALYGYTAQEISNIEAVPLGTAKTRIRSGLIKVRALLRQDGTLPREPRPCAS